MNENTFVVRCRALILHEDKLLVVKHEEGNVHYALPGGKMEQGENPLECIKREILEELGVVVEDPKLAYIHNWKDWNGQENLEFLFLIKDGEKFLDISNNYRSHDFEIAELRWMSKTDDIVLKPKTIKTEFTQNGFDFEGLRFI